MSDEPRDRQSISAETGIVVDLNERAVREAENAIEQFDRVLDLIDQHVRDGRPFRLRPSIILNLHAIAMTGVHRMAGTYRNAPVTIKGSRHEPPREHLVPGLIEEMCDWIEASWSSASAIRLCAYLMWRLNWIHPFADGNGRTSRAVAYLVLCARAGDRLPGLVTIPEQIAADKPPYYDALEQADLAAHDADVRLDALELLLERSLKTQLDSAFQAARAASTPEGDQRKFH